MRILITNDDGVMAPALPHLINFAKTLGEVTAVAPKVEQSGKSHAIDFTRDIEIKKVDLGVGCEVFSMDSTPADCVRFARLGLRREFDLIISGVNRGFNLGADMVYSGTLGAAFEGARLGIPAMAISTDPKDFSYSISRLPDVFAFFSENGLLSECSLYNVNIPINDKGIRITRQGGIYFTDDFLPREGDMYYQVGEILKNDSRDLTLDTVSVINGYLSITPLTAEKTALGAYEKLSRLNKN